MLLGSERSTSSHVGVHEEALTNKPSVSWNQTMLWRFMGPRKTTETPSSKGAKGPLTFRSCRSRREAGEQQNEMSYDDCLGGGDGREKIQIVDATDGKNSKLLTRRTLKKFRTCYLEDVGRERVTGARLFGDRLVDRRDVNTPLPLNIFDRSVRGAQQLWRSSGYIITRYGNPGIYKLLNASARAGSSKHPGAVHTTVWHPMIVSQVKTPT